MRIGRPRNTGGTRQLPGREEPTREKRTAASADHDPSPGWGRSYPQIRMLTVAELLRGASIAMPPAHGKFAQAPRATGPAAHQGTLGLE